MSIDRVTYGKIVNFITGQVSNDPDARQMLLKTAFLGTPLVTNINTQGTSNLFAGRVIDASEKYGSIEKNQPALAVFLDVLSSETGGDVRAEAVALIRKFAPDYPLSDEGERDDDAPASPGEDDVKIFISYKREDEHFARLIAEKLSHKGAHIWMDVANIPAGMKWHTAINEGLKECEVMLLIVTPEAMASKNVADEWEYFHSKDKPIIPLYLRNVEEMPFQLNRIQRIDFRNDFDAGFSRLERTLTDLNVM